MKKLSVKWLLRVGACSEAVEAFSGQDERDTFKILGLLVEQDRLDWANWLLPRLLSKKGRVRYAVYAASRVLPIFEAKYPEDTRPRKAIAAARRWLKDPSGKNAGDAWAAAGDAWAAAGDAWAAGAAAGDAWAAAGDAWAAGDAAGDAAWAAAGDARAAARDAGDAAWAAAGDAWAAVFKKIVDYGIKLLKKEMA